MCLETALSFANCFKYYCAIKWILKSENVKIRFVKGLPNVFRFIEEVTVMTNGSGKCRKIVNGSFRKMYSPKF